MAENKILINEAEVEVKNVFVEERNVLYDTNIGLIIVKTENNEKLINGEKSKTINDEEIELITPFNELKVTEVNTKEKERFKLKDKLYHISQMIYKLSLTENILTNKKKNEEVQKIVDYGKKYDIYFKDKDDLVNEYIKITNKII